MKRYWIPVDASGEALPVDYDKSSCYGIHAGGIAKVFFDFTLSPGVPSVDTKDMLIGNMPFRSARGQSNAGGGVVLCQNNQASYHFQVIPDSTGLYVSTLGGVRQRNVDLATGHFFGNISYAVDPVGPFVVLGDSITYEFPFSTYMHGAINAGIEGDHSWDMIKRLEMDVLRFDPSVVHILAGTNDIQSMKIDPMFVEAIARMCEAKGARVLIGTIPPFAHSTWNVETAKTIVGEWNYNLRAMCERNGFELIDYHRLFLLANGEANSALYLSDMVHPNSDGQAVMFDLMRRYI